MSYFLRGSEQVRLDFTGAIATTSAWNSTTSVSVSVPKVTECSAVKPTVSSAVVAGVSADSCSGIT